MVVRNDILRLGVHNIKFDIFFFFFYVQQFDKSCTSFQLYSTIAAHKMDRYACILF